MQPSALRCLLLLSLLGAEGVARARTVEPVLAVLYVDNHSGDAELDVLEKGLADMLVTDLAAQGLTVVERARLQALIDEQALQQTAFFDPKTAVRVGKGLGASHVLIGALVTAKPEMRLDVRLVDVATGQITVTATAQGASERLFELEQTLVQRFVEAFERRFAPSPTAQTRVKDVAALLEYSHGLDLADRGELDEAQQRIDRTIRLSPGFALARKRKDELAARIAASRDRRDALLEEDRAALAKGAREALAAAATGEALLTRLAWRDVEIQLRALELVTHLSDRPFGVAALGHEKALRAAMQALAESMVGFVEDLDRMRASQPPRFARAALPADDEKRARAAGLDTRVETDPVAARLRVARFLLLGRVDPGQGDSATVAPPLASLDAAWDKRAFALLGEAKGLAQKDTSEHMTIETLDLWAEALYLRGRTDDAVAKWQEILDLFPTSSRFDNIERRVKAVLGLARDPTTADLESWARGLSACLDMPLRVGLDAIVYRRMRLRGLDALAETVAEVEKACQGQASARQFWDYLYSHVALVYGKHGRCAEFEALMERGRKVGTSPADIAGWRKNWTRCPLPASP